MFPLLAIAAFFILAIVFFVLGKDDFGITRLKEDPNLIDSETAISINSAKRQFARIRIPLAKKEPSNKYKTIDYAVPKLGANDIQLGWQINDNETIWYRDLSDLAISILNKIRAFRIQENLEKHA